MKRTIVDIIILIRNAARRFNDNDPIMLAGALAFFTVFAIPPILIIIIHTIGVFIGHQAANTATFDQIELIMGTSGANVLRNIVEHYFSGKNNVLQLLIRIGIFIFASSSFFIIIQHALNKIWQVKPKPQKNVLNVLKNRALSFAIIILMGLILCVSLATKAVFISIHDDLDQLSPFLTPFILTTLSILLSFVLGILSFGVLFKFLPDVIIEWKVVWVGAAITSFLFLLGRYIIGFALRGSNVETMYGTAGSMAIFLLWVFYSSIILFFGAKITQQYALSFAESIEPKKHAVKIFIKEIDHA